MKTALGSYHFDLTYPCPDVTSSCPIPSHPHTFADDSQKGRRLDTQVVKKISEMNTGSARKSIYISTLYNVIV